MANTMAAQNDRIGVAIETKRALSSVLVFINLKTPGQSNGGVGLVEVEASNCARIASHPLDDLLQ